MTTFVVEFTQGWIVTLDAQDEPSARLRAFNKMRRVTQGDNRVQLRSVRETTFSSLEEAS